MLLHSDNNLINRYKDILNESKNIVIFSPYIKKNTLNEVIDNCSSELISIITTWKPIDIATGVTDIEVYEICQKNNIQLLINNRIHLKSIVLDNFTSCTVSSSNITNRGLALNNMYNYELGIYVEQLTIEDKCYFDSIIDNAIAVTDEYYHEIIKQVQGLPATIKEIPEDFILPEETNKNYLTSNLPYFDNPELLFEVVVNQEKYGDEDIRSAFHDLKLYQVEQTSSKKQMYLSLKRGFKKHFFIKDFLEFSGEGKYFGELSTWLHGRIKNVPCPKRFEVKEYQQRIYSYIEYLLEDEYQISIPKSHSQYLERIKHE